MEKNVVEKSVAFTGHRVLTEARTDIVIRLTDLVLDLIRQGYDTFYTGMAIGFDLLAAQVIISLKRKYPLYLVAVIPFPNQNAKFDELDTKLYFDVLNACDERIILSPAYDRQVYFKRNAYLVDSVDTVIAYLHDESGGTAQTVKYAKKRNKKIIYV